MGTPLTDRPVEPPADPGRRLFFRRFAAEAVTAATSVLGAASVLQAESAEAARGLLGPGPLTGARAAGGGAAGGAGTGAQALNRAGAAGYRTAFTWDDDVCRVVDQRRLPGALVDFEVKGTADAVNAIRDRVVVGAAAEAQVAAIALALTALRARASRPLARRATIRGGANALIAARPGAAAVAAAVGRVRARYEALPADADGEFVASELQAEADTIVFEAMHDHGALAEHGAAALPVPPDRALRVLLHGSSGTMAGGQFGSAQAAVLTLHHAGRMVETLVTEARPGLEGARVAAWELAQAGVRVTIVSDAGAPSLLAGHEADVVLVVADRVAANGDVVATAGAYPLALAAARAGVPFVVFAPTTAVDLATPDGPSATVEEWRAGEILRFEGRVVAADGASGRAPRQDRTSAELVSAIVTEEGVLRPPYGDALAAAVAAADLRRAASPGFAALAAAALLPPAGADHEGDA